MKKVLLFLIFVSCIFKINAQFSINDYKYVIVEKQFHFQNEPNEYDLNELTRFLLKKHGFRPVLEGDIFPDDLKSNYCLALQCEVSAKGFLKTTVTVALKDCNNNIVFQAEGTTKEKDFNKVYSYGIREAFENFKTLNYNYIPKKNTSTSITTTEEVKPVKENSAEVEKLKAEIEELKKAKEKAEENASKKIEEAKPKIEDNSEKIKTKSTYFEAVTTDNGYDLVNAENKKVIYVLTKTGMDNVFTVKGNNGIVYKKDGKWILEYTKGKKTVMEILNIIF